jgi:2-methylaconitate cis-trans-isomerase PrpF/tripartite-type tricarboxylate transporter receptor subunit TctC
MRAGTSRGPFFLREWLPEDPAMLEQALVGAIGASDPLQLDGLGGGSSLNSKVAIVSRSTEPGCDLDYLFAQVGVGIRSVDLRPNCGNMLSGVVPFAIERGLIEPQRDRTTVRVFNVNTRARIDVTVCTPGGRLTYEGNARIDGVAGTAAPVLLSFLDCWGAVTGTLFPTGNRIDTIGDIEVTCIDAAMPLMIVRAQALDSTGREAPSELDANIKLLATLESLRRIAGERMGLGDVSASVVPKPVLVSAGDDHDSVTSRYFTPHRCHSSHAVTGAIGVATALALPGTVASGCARQPGTHMLAVLHPEGRIEVEMELSVTGDSVRIERAALLRTARRIMQGELTLPEYVFSGAADTEKRASAAASREETLHPRLEIIVPTNPGGTNDAIAQLIAREFGARGTTEVRVDNRAGANGSIACQHARRAAPDGSTLLLGYTATHGIHPAWEDVGYDPSQDFAPVGGICASPTVLIVRSCSPLDSVAALIDLLQRPSQRLRYAASGRGTLTHLAAELLAHLAGCTLQPRFFPGSAPAMAEVLQGGADFMVASLYTALPHLRSGTLRALAVSSGAHYPELAGVPSMQEAGLTELDIVQWYGLFAPRETPDSIVKKLNDELTTMLSRAEIADELRAQGAMPVGGTSDELAQLLITESRRWRKVIGTLRTLTLSETVD